MRRPGRACYQCRAGKRKCDRPAREACQPCVKRQITCSSAAKTRGVVDLRPADQVSLQTDALDNLTQETIVQLVDHYIDFIHDKPHSLFHAPTLRQSVVDGSISRALLCCILSMGARFSQIPDARALGLALQSQAKLLLHSDLETMSLSTIQAWVLLGNLCGADCNFAAESLYFGIAIRQALITRLESGSDFDSAVERETKSRVWWSLFMIDRWSSAGLSTPRQLSERDVTQQLPRAENVFHSLSPDEAFWPSEDEDVGMWAHMITLVELFGPIQDLNRSLVQGSIDEQSISNTVGYLAERLDRWQTDLPDNVRLSGSSLNLHKARGHGRTLVALHLGYYHYATLLYFQFLDQSALGLPFAPIYAERCREHASAFSDLLRTSYEVEGCGAMYNIVGHMCIVSSSVLIHTLLFGQEDHLPSAKIRLESNFKALMKLRSWWPSVDGMTEKLFLFQKACLRSADNHTHKMDRWMVKYLLEHGNPLGEKLDEDNFDTPSPASFTGRPELQTLAERNEFTRHALSGLRANSHYNGQVNN